MALSLHQLALPPLARSFNNLSAILDKAEAHCTAKKIDPLVLVNYRLTPDMLPFFKQIQIASDQAKGLAARLAGVEIPKFEDTEKTFADLKERIAKTIAFMNTIKPAQLDGAETKDIALKVGPNELKFTGLQYLTEFVQPNF